MIEVGDFIESYFGVGLVLNKYKGDRSVFHGKQPIVSDILYEKILVKQNELANATPLKYNQVLPKEKREMIVGVFERINIR